MQTFYVKIRNQRLKWTYGLFGQDYRGALLSNCTQSTCIRNHLAEFEIIWTILTCLNENPYVINSDRYYRVALLSKLYLTA